MPIDEATTDQRVWLAELLAVAADGVAGTVAGSHVYGWHDRTVGARINTPTGPRWLRVISEHDRFSGGGQLDGQ